MSEPADPGVDPWRVGRRHEQSASEQSRRSRGAFYTPQHVVEGLLRLAIERGRVPSRVLDPTCGGGAFLVGTLDRLVELGVAPVDAFGCVYGIDVDQGAVDATRSAVLAWGLANELPDDDAMAESLAFRVVVGDALDGLPETFPIPDLVVGNPPFATPLKGNLFPSRAVDFRTHRTALFGPYVDLAALHLLSATELCQGRSGARVVFVLPQSVLAARDGAGMREHLAKVAPPLAIWATADLIFEANVRVCALILELGADPSVSVSIAGGPDVVVLGSQVGGTPWAAAAAASLGAPAVELKGERLGSLVSATAGFRDEYYALAAVCRELSDVAQGVRVARVATVGSLDPLLSKWGQEPTKFAKKQWHEPVVDLDELARTSQIDRWLSEQLRPKVLLPTQSRVFEPVIDRSGVLAPVTPVLSIHADPEDLNRVAAVFLAPPIVAWAYRRWFGAAMSVWAIKVAARDLADFPLPARADLWEEAAELVGNTDDMPNEHIAMEVKRIGLLMNAAYGGSDETYGWWHDRYVSGR